MSRSKKYKSEQLERIANINTDYADNDIDDILAKVIGGIEEFQIVTTAQSSSSELIANELLSFKTDNSKTKLVMPIHATNEGHFVCLYIEKQLNSSNKIIYIDPRGKDDPQFSNTKLNEIKLLVQQSSITGKFQVSKTKIQIYSNYQPNNNCGAYVSDLLIQLAKGTVRINDNDKLEVFNQENENWNEIKVDSYKSSLKIGENIRKRYKKNLSNDLGFKTPPKQIIKETKNSQTPIDTLTQKLNKLDITPNKYRGKTFFRGHKTKLNKGKIKLDNRDKQNKKDGRNTAIKYPVIIQSPNKYEIKESTRTSGNDELFQTANKKEWEGLDKEFNLKPNENSPTFIEAFKNARVKTKELHTFNSGHTGAIYDSINGKHQSSQITSGYFKKDWDLDKNKIIKKVTKSAKTSEEKESSPQKATSEVLKLAVEKTVGYRQNTKENESKFKHYLKKKQNHEKSPFTNAGLDLGDETEREYALKAEQAARDKWKMCVVALEGRFNNVDSDDENKHEDKTPKSVIKRKVRRTKIKKEIHDGEDREFSPIRSGSPYSNFSFDYNFENLQKAVEKGGKEKYIAITDVFAQPTSAIKPDKKLKEEITKIKRESQNRTKTTNNSESLAHNLLNDFNAVDETESPAPVLQRGYLNNKENFVDKLLKNGKFGNIPNAVKISKNNNDNNR